MAGVFRTVGQWAAAWLGIAAWLAAGLTGLAMDQARVETKVDDAVATYGVTGQGVIVAILDRGIDFTNMDFRNADGSTRIAYIYDLTDDTGSNSPSNPYHLGTIYTRAQINAALAGGPGVGGRDALGHGTCTTGITAGNGNNVWKYRGIAYNATIITVKVVSEAVPAHGNQPAEIGVNPTSRYPTAWQFVHDKAAELGMPAVMLLNVGSSGGPMDGTSSQCQSLDATVGPGIPGLVFVTGSSDDGGTANHAAGTVAQGGTNSLVVHMGDAAPLTLDVWYARNDRFNVTIRTPNGSNYGPYISPAGDPNYDNEVTTNFNYWHYGGTANTSYKPASHKREIYVNLTGPSGNYTINLVGTTITNGGHFDASLNPAQYWDTSTSSNYFTSDVVSGYTVWDLASASNNICPNDYVHRTNWVDFTGIARVELETGSIGQSWSGTGVGPTYDGRIGIDVSAPGDSVFTTYNTNSWDATFSFNEIQDGLGLYGRQNATSGANPQVTGIVALMLEMNPLLDAPTVKRILQQSATVDSFTGAVPNTTWGYGKVNALAAVGMVKATLPQLSVMLTNQAQALITVASGAFGRTNILQTSSDLLSWAPLATNTAFATNFTIADTNALISRRFYRMLQTP